MVMKNIKCRECGKIDEILIKESGDYVCDDYVLRAPLILPNKAIIYSQSV